MKSFSITDLAGLSGVQAHTLRVWETRYALLNPVRVRSNYRSYSLEEVDYLLKICLLNRAGFKISQLARLDNAGLEQTLKDLQCEKSRFCRIVDKLIVSMFGLNVDEFEAVLDSSVIHWGIDSTISDIILPFIERTQLYSCKDCGVETDFAITSLRKKMILGIEKTNPSVYASKTVFLFLPKEEHFDLLMLYAYYLAKRNGLGVLYMGTNVSFNKIKNVTEIKRPDHLITYTSQSNKTKMQVILDNLRSLPHQSTLVAYDPVPGAHQNGNNFNLVYFKELPGLLNGIAAA